MKHSYQRDTLMKVGVTWFIKSALGWKAFTVYKGQYLDKLQKAGNKQYSPDEVKARGMRWVTIRGARVLLQGVGDSWVVVGGAGGKLNHMKIDRILSKEDYKEKRDARAKRKKEAGKELTPEDKAKEQAKSEERKQQEDVALTDYAKKVNKITSTETAVTTENIGKVETAANREIAFDRKALQAMLTPEEIEAIRERAKDHVESLKRYREKGEKYTPENKDMQTHIDKEIDRQVKRGVKDKIHDAEQQATERVASEMLDVKVGDKGDLPDVNLDQAKEILKLKRDFKTKMKDIYGEKASDDTDYRVGMTYAGNMEADFDGILEEVKRDIETQKNIEFYDKIDAKYDQVGKHIDGAAASALNGIMADSYGTGAYFNSDMVKELGIDAVARAIAYKIKTDGKDDLVKDALIQHSNNVRLKTVNEALKSANDSIDNTKGIMDLADDDSQVFSKAVANGYAMRHRNLAIQELAGAAGSLRAMAHMIDALEDPPNDLLQIDMGRDLARAHRRMDKAGLKSDQYSMKKQKGGRFMAEIKSSSLTPFFENSHEMTEKQERINAIKKHELNTGQLAKGMREGMSWSAEAPDAQESGYRFAKDQKRVLLDYKPGLGKTFITANLVADAVTSGKKMLIVVPATLKEQMVSELKKFTNDDVASQVKSSFDFTKTGGLKEQTQSERRARYAEGGVHIISHNALKNDKEHLLTAGFDNIVVDEVHQLINAKEAKGANSATYRSLKDLSSGAESLVAMTGTPIKTSKIELKKIGDLVNPDNNLGTNAEFMKRHKGVNQTTSAFQSSSVEAIRKEADAWSFSQGYELKPKHTVKEKAVQPNTEQKSKIKNIQDQYALSKLEGKTAPSATRDMELWRATHLTGGKNNPKFRAVVDDIRKNREGQKGLLFMSQGPAKEGSKIYAKQLNEEFGGGTAQSISSDTTPTQLKRYKEMINDPTDNLRFLVGTETLSTGHNLQGATFIHHVDVPQSKAQSSQQEARSYRKGQMNDVNTVHFHSADPNDINKRFNYRRKSRESDIVGNTSAVAGRDDSGFGSILHELSQKIGA